MIFFQSKLRNTYKERLLRNKINTKGRGEFKTSTMILKLYIPSTSSFLGEKTF